MSVELENVRKDIRQRDETDSIMSMAWLIVPFLPAITVGLIFASVIASIFAFNTSQYRTGNGALPLLFVGIGGAIILITISFLLSLLLNYKLIQRRNTHFKRQRFLFEDLVKATRKLASKKEVDVEATLSSCERTIREAEFEETEKGALLWSILSAIIPFISWYVYYFLMKDFYKHERREDGFWEDLSRALNRVDIKHTIERRTESIPNRSFVLYFILTIITMGLFAIYWIYILLKDPNIHFKYHIKEEDSLLSDLKATTT